jgi:formiminoglutamase
MKILPIDPKNSCSTITNDGSRLGHHVRPINLSDLSSLEHGIVIFGIADDTGIRNVGGRTGAREGPLSARNRLYKFTTGSPSLPIYDLGDLIADDKIEETHAQAAKVVSSIMAAKLFPIVIGGGHDLGFPHALGLLQHSRTKTKFWNIDAHLDVRSTEKGITSGSPWYLLREHKLFQETKSSIEEFGIQPHCNAESLVAYAKTHRFGLHWLHDLRKKRRPADEIFVKLLGPAKSTERLLVSLDIDSVDFANAPGCSAPQTLGFSPAEVIQMSFSAGAHGRVDSFGIFELSPPLDPDGRTSLLVAHCINACIQGVSSRRRQKKK